MPSDKRKRRLSKAYKAAEFKRRSLAAKLGHERKKLVQFPKSKKKDPKTAQIEKLKKQLKKEKATTKQLRLIMTHRDGSKATQPSRLRYLRNAQKLWDMMERAEHEGNQVQVAAQIAKKYGVDIQEVYTLWKSM